MRARQRRARSAGPDGPCARAFGPCPHLCGPHYYALITTLSRSDAFAHAAQLDAHAQVVSRLRQSAAADTQRKVAHIKVRALWVGWRRGEGEGGL